MQDDLFDFITEESTSLNIMPGDAYQWNSNSCNIPQYSYTLNKELMQPNNMEDNSKKSLYAFLEESIDFLSVKDQSLEGPTVSHQYYTHSYQMTAVPEYFEHSLMLEEEIGSFSEESTVESINSNQGQGITHEVNESFRNEFKFSNLIGSGLQKVDEYINDCEINAPEFRKRKRLVEKIFIIFKMFLSIRMKKADIQTALSHMITENNIRECYLKEMLGVSKLQMSRSSAHKESFAIYLAKILISEFFCRSIFVCKVLKQIT